MPELRNATGVYTPPVFSHAGIAPAGSTVAFLTGQVAWDEAGKVVGSGDIQLQLDQTWRNIRGVLSSMGLAMSDVIKLVTYTTDPRFKNEITAAKMVQFSDSPPPASTFLVVSGLADPELLVEIEVIAVMSANQGIHQS